MTSSRQIEGARPLRSDAERNRRLILDAAREAFATGGLQVSLDEIARRAGVGVGTVYRRFADKEALIDALFQDGLAELVAQAEAALREEDPWAGFVRWFEGFVGLQAEDRGLKEVVLSSTHGHDRIAASRERLIPLVSQLIERAQATGALRPDLRATDLPMLAQMIGDVADSTRELSPELFKRYLAVVLDGLRVSREGPSHLPTPALSLDQLETVRRSQRR